MRNFSNRKKIDYIGNTNIKGTLMQIFCQYLHLHMKIICWRFHIKTPTFWDMRMWNMWKVCLQTFRNNKIWWKLAYFLTDLSNSRANNSRILRIKNAKFSGCCFYMNAKIQEDFQICISVPLKKIIWMSKSFTLKEAIQCLHESYSDIYDQNIEKTLTNCFTESCDKYKSKNLSEGFTDSYERKIWKIFPRKSFEILLSGSLILTH